MDVDRAFMTFPVASLAIQSWPVAERFLAGVAGGVGEVTSLTLASKLANVPGGVIGYALGTSRFQEELASKGQRKSAGWSTTRSYVTLLAALALSGGAGYLAGLSLPAALGTGNYPNLPLLCALYFAMAPIMVVASVRTQQILGRRDLATYSRAVVGFVLAYGIVSVGIVARDFELRLAAQVLGAVSQ